MGNKLGRRRVVVDDKYTRPQGLYQHRDVDHKKLRKLILDSKLAPCYPGDEDCAADLDECPICFLYYPSLNRSRCCMKGICTECFLQMKPPHSARPTQCPFCKTSNYAVEYRGVKTKEEKGKEQIEEQRVIEAKIRMQQQQRQNDEEKMQKRQALSSSSRIMFPGEVGYQDIASSSVSVTDAKHAAQGGEVLSSQSSCALAGNLRPSSSGQIREDEADMDLEEMMVMEAIWLSIQEQHSTSNGASISPIVSSSADDYPMHAVIPAKSYHSNELACAVGTVGQSQHINEDGTNTTEISSGSFRTISHLNCISNGDKSLVGNCSQGDWVDRSSHDGPMALGEDSEWAVDHSSNVAEAGTSYSSSDVMFDGGTVLSCPDVLNMPAGHLLPETFEEQMMLAMAVSLADSRARTNTQGIPWL